MDLDVGECSNVGTIEYDPNANCTNTEGSYVCRCRKEYEGDCTGTDKSFLIKF